MAVSELAVLLIEDNPGDVRLIEEMLHEASDRSAGSNGSNEAPGRELWHADRLDDGLAQLDDTSVDVVLLDLGLPDSTGIDTLETVRDHSREVPVVVLTGLDDETVGDRAVQQGAQEYLVKDELTPPLLHRSLRHAIERKKFERTQTALHDASRDLIKAESKTEVSHLAVDTAVDVLDLSGIAIYLFDGSTNDLQPAAYTDYIEDIFGEMPSFGPDNSAITWQTFISGETTTQDDVLDAEHVYRTDTPFRSGIWIPLGDHGVLAIVSDEVGGFDQQRQQLADHLAATTEAALDRVAREASLREQEQDLTRQNRKLEDLNRMNGLIREIDQVLVRATTRDEIEAAVCERLVQDERFAFAWFGEAVDGERVTPRTWAGAGQGYLDAVSLATNTDERPPAVTATSTGRVTFTQNVATDLRGASWRKAALTRDLQSVISVPLTYNELSYGVLTVFATEPDAFDPRSRDTFEELGETIANAMNSVETRQALLTDTVVELELAINESDDVLVQFARATDSEFEYGGAIPQSDGTTRLFVSANDADESAFHAVAKDVPSVRQFDRIGETAGADDRGESRFEVSVSGQTLPSTLAECGAVARSFTATDSEVRVVVELPNTTDIRTFINRLEETYPGTELIARRDKERSDRSQQAFDAALTDELTDRQLEALQTAYLSGYFEWPRERTGEEVAESLDITQPTFNGHLRAAERKLCAMLFGGDS